MAAVLGLTAAVGLSGGCQSQPPAAAGPSTITDSCSEGLHDLCGLLLQYHLVHGKLPDRLEDLQQVAGPDEKLTFVCPASGRPYLYDKNGMTIPGQPGLVILRDPLPSHSGIRWAIAIIPSDSTQPLNTRVIALAENPPAPAR